MVTHELVASTLPIADLRSLPHDLVLQTIAPGEVVLRISATTKNGLKLAKSSQGTTILTVPQIIVNTYGQNGEIGNMVPSTRNTKPELHFVTPKKTTELPEDKVLLYAIGIDHRLFEQFFKWDPQFPPDPADLGSDSARVLNRRVSRLAPGKFPVAIIEKSTNKVVAKVNVWVVWADSVTPFQTGKTILTSLPYQITNGNIPTSNTAFMANPLPYWKFTFAIQPLEIIKDVIGGLDAPQLAGKLPQNTYVPGGDGAHPVLGNTGEGSSGQFKYGASHFWDVSRQMEVTVNNPGLIPWSDFANGLNDLYSNQKPTAQAYSTPIPFPTDPVMGNDDVGRLSKDLKKEKDQIAGDEDNNPYASRFDDFLQLKHKIGEVTSNDGPSAEIPDVAGVEGREYEELYHFREFVRLKLPGGWFRVSDYVDWHFDMKVKFTGGHWRDNGCNPKP